MLRCDTLRALQVGDGARNLYDAVVGAGREFEVIHGALQEVGAALIQWCELSQH